MACLIPNNIKATATISTTTGGTTTSTSRVLDQTVGQNIVPTVATQGLTAPNPVPSSGLVFSFGKAGLSAEASRLGTIMTDTADIVGKHKLYVGESYQFLRFTQIGLGSVFQGSLLANENLRGSTPIIYDTETGEIYLGGAQQSVDLKIHQFATDIAFGVSNRLELRAVVPYSNVRMGVSVTCTTLCTSTGHDYIYPIQVLAANQTESFTITPSSGFMTKTGIGDVSFGAKYKVFGGTSSKSPGGVAVVFTARVPTGDKLNLLGTGAYGYRADAVGSGGFTEGRLSRFSGTFDFAFQYNGRSTLANFGDSINTSNPIDGRGPIGKPNSPGKLANAEFFDVEINTRITHNLDLLAGILTSAFSNNAAVDQLDAELFVPVSGSFFGHGNPLVGLKVSPVSGLVIAASGLFETGSTGLQHSIEPIATVSYTF
jgi:hypothetical protein